MRLGFPFTAGIRVQSSSATPVRDPILFPSGSQVGVLPRLVGPLKPHMLATYASVDIGTEAYPPVHPIGKTGETSVQQVRIATWAII